MDPRPSLELLDSAHVFPGVYKFKAIGDGANHFEERVISAVRSEVGDQAAIAHTVRSTKGGRHVSLTLDVDVQNAEQVHLIYAKIRDLDGLLLLL